jgi:homogentisate phytyltransferase/homogentisate geranylgeranyltransferase
MLQSLWQFSRPHTIYGTTVSLVGLYLLALGKEAFQLSYLLALWLGLLACLAANVYIVGLNQLLDIEIDKINKPYLPLAAGTLTSQQGLITVVVSGILGILLSLTEIPYLFLTVGISSLIGTAYSLPPLRLKRFPVTAALCIYSVRGTIVNFGLYAYFCSLKPDPVTFSAPIVVLTLFISVFGLVIAIFKDIPDMEGDRAFQISTFSLRWGKDVVFHSSVVLLSICYLGMLVSGLILLPEADGRVVTIIHLLGLGILVKAWKGTSTNDDIALTQFYRLIWKLFYLEYLLYPLAFLI